MHTIQFDSHLYPSQLREIPDPPTQLYARGNTELLQNEQMIAVVGARKATAYGRTVVQQLIPHVVSANCIVVSGLAFGIDAEAHTATLNASGRTIAVLPSSVIEGEVAPRSNQPLARRILENGGLLLSEYPPGTRTYSSNYHERNRIIAGLSLATVVVEGSFKSGSLITARHCVEYNRDLLAVPGPITSPLSAGPNKLLAQGAVPYTGHESLFEQIGHRLQRDINASLPPLLLTNQERTVLALYGGNALTMDEAIQSRPDSLQPHMVIQSTMSLLVKGAVLEVAPSRYVASSAQVR